MDPRPVIKGKITPVSDKVHIELVTNLSEYKKEYSRFHISDDVRQGTPNRGIVISIGEDIEKPLYSVGDLIIFKSDGSPFQGYEVNGKPTTFIQHEDIIAVVK